MKENKDIETGAYKPLKIAIDAIGTIELGLLSYGAIGSLMEAELTKNPILPGSLIALSTIALLKSLVK